MRMQRESKTQKRDRGEDGVGSSPSEDVEIDPDTEKGWRRGRREVKSK